MLGVLLVGSVGYVRQVDAVRSVRVARDDATQGGGDLFVAVFVLCDGIPTAFCLYDCHAANGVFYFGMYDLFNVPCRPMAIFTGLYVVSNDNDVAQFTLIALIALVSFYEVFEFRAIGYPMAIGSNRGYAVLAIFALIAFSDFGNAYEVIAPNCDSAIAILRCINGVLADVGFYLWD